MLKSTVVTAYRAAFPKDTATRNKEDAKKKIHIFWDKITQLESIAEDDATKQVTRRFILVMVKYF
ncbi:unnamed protein product [Gongylonema pulchrum]|uniref:DUF148 domain-containing protein n=1 Tax=Gongylonema pulchrum TaxID=637853 RepID=A0A183DK47_9BILA|nr:unnamed protein product [Gongylonema pulchrum]